MNLTKLIGNFNFRKYSKASRTDFGVLKVAFMVAALDGEVTESELRALDALAKKCRGYTPKTAEKALDEAMRSAGYLMLFGRRAKDSALVAAFVREALAALPNGFAYYSVEDVRRAVVTWIAMGMSDGDYSAREKKCIEALRKHLAELKVCRAEVEAEEWTALSPSLRMGCVPGRMRSTIKLVSRDFMTRVEGLVAQYGDSADAATALESLISAEA